MILVNPLVLPPPADLLEQAIKTGKLEDLEHWFINQRSPGYSFQTIADFVSEQRSAKKTKRAPSTTRQARKAPTKKEEVTPL
jgi:hypothetical protein